MINMGYYLIYDEEYKIVGLSSQKQERSVFVKNIEDIKITNESYFDIENNVIRTKNKFYKINEENKNDFELDVDLV